MSSLALKRQVATRNPQPGLELTAQLLYRKLKPLKSRTITNGTLFIQPPQREGYLIKASGDRYKNALTSYNSEWEPVFLKELEICG